MGNRQAKYSELQKDFKVQLIAGKKRSKLRQNELVTYNRKLRAELEKLVNEDKTEMAKLKAVE